MATVGDVVAYLKTHPADATRTTPEFLVFDDERRMAYIRWPSGTVRWETVESLLRRGFPPPERAEVP